MAWNRSDNADAVSLPHRDAKRSFLRHGFIVAAVVVLGAALVWWLRTDDDKKTETPPSSDRQHTIMEATPADAPTNAAPVINIPHRRLSEMSREEKLKWYRDRYGDNIPETLKPTVYFLEHPPTTVYKPLPRPVDIFEHQSERTLASIVLMEPGAFMLRRPTYDESFDEDFAKSLEKPTLVTKDDTPEERELKESVNEVKSELAERLRKGEKPSDVLNAAMESAYELSKYRQNIQTMLYDCEDDSSKSNEDIEDFVQAANRLLAEKGAAPIAMPSLLRRQTRLNRLARQAERKAADKDNNQNTRNEQ